MKPLNNQLKKGWKMEEWRLEVAFCYRYRKPL